MEGEIHLGKNGPAPCPAKVKCRVGGAHYSNMHEAEKTWAEKNGVKAAPDSMRKESGKKNASTTNGERSNVIAKKQVLFPYASREEVAKLQREVMALQPLYGTYEAAEAEFVPVEEGTTESAP